MRTNIILMLALLVFLVGFFSSQISLTGNTIRSDGFTSLSNEELAAYDSLTIDDCRDISRFSAYNYESRHYTRVADPNTNPTITSGYQFKSNTYLAFDITGDGEVDTEDVNLCYSVVREFHKFSRDPNSRPRPYASQPACSPEGREVCRHGVLNVCTPDAYGVLSWAEAAKPNAGERCHSGLGIIQRVIGKQPLDKYFLFTAP